MEKICLKWDYFEEKIANSIKKLRTADDFYDVTLVTDDQHQVSAHKIVLASSSEYFKNILNNNKHVHPLLCLTGVWLSDLNNILDYIYNGEVKIQQDHLDGFLQIARRFRVEGLVRGEDSDTSVVTNIRIRIRIRIFSSESRIFRFGFVIFARRIIFGFGFIIES